MKSIFNTHYIKKTKNLSGFTLVELIVVITILTILGTIAFTQMNGYSGSARDSQRVSDLANISQGLDLTYIKLSSFPAPDNAINITYSGGVLWCQGTIGDTVMNIFSSAGAKLSSKPTDPLTPTKEYTYSKTANSAYSYQLKTDYEGDSIAYQPTDTLIPQVSAATGNPTIAYIKGTYNGVVAKTITGSTTYIIASPSIITSQTGTIGTNFEITTLANKLLLSGQTNSGGIAFTGKLVFSSGALPSTDAERLTFATTLANTYSGTSLETNPSIQSFSSARKAVDNTTLTTLGGYAVANWLGGVVISNNDNQNNIPAFCGNTGSITYTQAVNNQAAIYNNITNYIGCKINDYPGGSGSIAGTTVLSKVLIASQSDDSTSIAVKTTNSTTANTTSETDGLANTDAMAVAGLAIHPAAQLCRNKGVLWYFPAKDELNVFYGNLTKIGNFITASLTTYRSSTEVSTLSAWFQYYSNGGQSMDGKINAKRLRCASRF